MMKSPNSFEITTACAVLLIDSRGKLLLERRSSYALDRRVLHLPMIQPDNAANLHADVDKYASKIGIETIRRPMHHLGAVHHDGVGGARLVPIFSIETLDNSLVESEMHVALSQSEILQSGSLAHDSGQQHGLICDSLVWAATHLHFTRPGANGRAFDYEVFASQSLFMMKDDYVNSWFPEAQRILGEHGVSLSMEVLDDQPGLKVLGRGALTKDGIDNVRLLFIDIGRHVKGRFWVTEVIDGSESLIDFADPSSQKLVESGRLVSGC